MPNTTVVFRAAGRVRSQPRRGAALVTGTAHLGEHQWPASVGSKDSTADRLQLSGQASYIRWRF